MLAALLALVATATMAASPARATAQPAAGLKAVFIVGPASYNTSQYIHEATDMARAAAAEGMSVHKVFTPNATWQNVLNVIQGANLVVYWGHGNGWPSPYPPYQEDTKDGFGLNPYAGAGYTSPTDYHGGNAIRAKVHLAPSSVVLLYRLCYAEGNAESGMAPMLPSSATNRNIATERVDNFAAAFLHVGAGVVFAWGWPQKINLPAQLAGTNKTMDQIFEDPTGHTGFPNAWIGTHDYYRDSKRTPGARIHLDPHPVYGHLRALSGKLTMSAADWRAQAALAAGPPQLSGVSVSANGTVYPAGSATVPSFSPNGDGFSDSLPISRSLSKPAYIDVSVAATDGTPVRSFTSAWSSSGPGTTTWDGTNDGRSTVADGTYRVTLTPRDKAGATGPPASIGVAVLTALRSPAASRSAIDVADGDALAPSVRFTVGLTQDATVTWAVYNVAGNVVRSYLNGAPTTAGSLGWTWNGRNDAGRVVADGTYRAVVRAVTSSGTVRYAVAVYVGPYRVRISDGTPARGQKVTVTVLATERQQSAPRLTIKQPGLAAYTVATSRLANGDYAATFTLHRSGSAGSLTVTIVGVDAAGNPDRQAHTYRIH